MSESKKIGIDFGTTNSAVCYLDGNNEVQAISFGSAQTPTSYVPSCELVLRLTFMSATNYYLAALFPWKLEAGLCRCEEPAHL